MLNSLWQWSSRRAFRDCRLKQVKLSVYDIEARLFSEPLLHSLDIVRQVFGQSVVKDRRQYIFAQHLNTEFSDPMYAT